MGQIIYQTGPTQEASIDQAIERAKNFSHRVTNPNVNEIVISFKSELSMQWQEDGSTKPERVSFAIFIVRRGVEYNALDSGSGCFVDSSAFDSSSDGSNGLMKTDKNFSLHGIAASTYQFDIKIKYDSQLNSQEISGGVSFKVVKLTRELDPTIPSNEYHVKVKERFLRKPKKRTWSTVTTVGGMNRSRDIMVAHVEERISKPFLYPHSAIAKIKMDSKNFSNIPERAYSLKLKKVLVPSNYNSLTRTYSGAWDGLFKGQNDSTQSIYSISDKDKQWTDNPAWIFYDIVSDPRYGCGKYGIEEFNIDKWQLYKIAKYCDELVETEYPIETDNGYMNTFSTNNNLDFTDVASEDGEFVIKIDKTYYENDSSGILQKKEYASSEAAEKFIKQFGSGESFKGKKVAFFISSHDHKPDDNGNLNESQIQDIKYRSVAKSGKIYTQERYIVSSDVDDFEVRLSGPSFFDNPSSFYREQDFDYVSVDYIKWVDLYRFDAYQQALSDGFIGSKNEWGKQDFIQAEEDDLVSFYLNGGTLPLLTEETKTTVGACATQINHPILEPRFSANIYLTDNSDALNIINNFASIFRGITSYASGKITALQDSYKQPIMLFNNSNIDKAGFAYAGTHKNKRYSAALVRFNNMAKNFDPDLVYEENSSVMQKFGYLQNETMGFGITSEGQARRLARWILFSSQLETEMVKFVAGQEASYLYPSSVFEVSDEMRAGNLRSGRILDIRDEGSDTYILIDKSIASEPIIGNIELTVSAGISNETQESIENASKFEKDVEDQDSSIDFIRSAQILRFDALLNPSFREGMIGPQGQKTLVSNLNIKIPFTVLVDSDIIISNRHGLVNGDVIRFVSDGVLPSGLEPHRQYQVASSTKNSFELRYFGSQERVAILDEGKDYLLNSGGIHYIYPLDYQYTKDALDQLMIGSSYSIKGDIAVTEKSVNKITTQYYDALGINSISSDGWSVSNIFGNVKIVDSNWMFAINLGWIYINDMLDRDVSSEDYFWFYVYGVGWVSTKESIKNKNWYISELDEGSDSTNGFIYLKYDSEGIDVEYVFVYDSSATQEEVEYVLGGTNNKVGRKFKINNRKENEGYWLSLLYDGQIISEDQPPIEEASASFFDQNPAYKNASIIGVYQIESNTSMSYKNEIRIELDDSHGLDLERNSIIRIYSVGNSNLGNYSDSDLRSIINKRWSYVFVNENVIELINSSDVYENFDKLDFSGSGAYYIDGLKNNSERYIQGQLFRTMSVKEISENKYEVTGLEYSPFKFGVVDKKGSTKQPAMPIPPQADMQIPEAPTDLTLYNLTI